MNVRRIALIALLIAAALAFYRFDLGRFLSLEYFKSQHAAIEAWRAAHPANAALYYFLAYVAITALSLPGAAPLTLAGGAIFGLACGQHHRAHHHQARLGVPAPRVHLRRRAVLEMHDVVEQGVAR